MEVYGVLVGRLDTGCEMRPNTHPNTLLMWFQSRITAAPIADTCGSAAGKISRFTLVGPSFKKWFVVGGCKTLSEDV